MNALKGLGVGSFILVLGVLALSLTLILPILSLLAVVVGVIGLAIILGQQYYAYLQEKEQDDE